MRILDSVIDFFSFGVESDGDLKNRWKTRIFSLVLFLFFIITFAQGIYSLAVENAVFAIVTLSFCCYFLFSLMLSFNKTESSFWPTSHAIGVMVYLIFIYVSDILTGTSSLSVVVYPFLALLFCGKDRGIILSFLFLLFLLMAIFIPYEMFHPGVVVTKLVGSVHLVVGLLATVIAYAIRHLWEDSLVIYERNMIEAQNKVLHKEEVISQISHQIRTPLSNIIGVIDLMEKTPLSDIQYDYVNTIHASANNMVNVVNAMVAANQQGLQILPAEEISFNIYATINNVLRLFQDKSSAGRFSVKLSPDIPSTLIGNSILVKQVFLNVINSLLKYNQGESNSLSIRVDCGDIVNGNVDLMFKISVNHPSKTVKQVNASVEMQKTQNVRQIQQLDLSLTQQLIEAENKKMTIDTDGEGLIVNFALQFRENLQFRNVSPAQDKIKTVDSFVRNKVNIKDASILIVEDNFSNQQIITLYIKNEVNKIDVAFNGKEALDKFGSSKYDLILMDVQMPVMDGFKATQKIRDIEKSYNTRIPIIAVTANAFPEDREKCLQVGMDDYISKPFQPEELISKIKKLLN